MSLSRKLLITQPWPASYVTELDALTARLRDAGFDVVLDPRERNLNESELARVLPGVHVHIAGVDQYTDVAMDAADSLQLICRIGVGVENVDIEAATARGILVANTPGAGAETVAEFTFSLMAALSRRVTQSQDVVRQGEWRRSMGRSMLGKTLGIVGLGNIGVTLARLVSGLNMPVLAFDPWADAQAASCLGITLVPLETLLRASDYVSIHVPFNAETRDLIGQTELAMMKPSAMLINTSRGGIVNEAALYRALVDGVIDSAALDVLEQEPPTSEHPLLSLPNVIVTAHNAGTTYEGRNKLMQACVQTVLDVQQGRQCAGLKNPQIWSDSRLLSQHEH